MALVLAIKVVPSSGRSAFLLDKSGTLKVFLKSPPEDGKANKELIKLFAQSLACPQSSINLIAGAASRSKRIVIDLPLSYEDLLIKLGLDVQTRLPHQ